MKVVISLSECEQRCDEVVAWCSDVIVWLIAEVVSDAVDTERAVMHDHRFQQPSVHIATDPVTPQHTAHESREEEGESRSEVQVVLMLKANQRVSVQITDVAFLAVSGVRLHKHPAEVSVPTTHTDNNNRQRQR